MSADRPPEQSGSARWSEPARLPPRTGSRRAQRTPVRPFVVGTLVTVLAGLLATVVLSTAPSASSVRSTELHAHGETTDHGRDGTTRARRGVGTTRVDAAQRVLRRQAAAIEGRDRRDYLATIDPHARSKGFAAIAERTFDNLRRMDVTAVRFDELVVDAGALPPKRRAKLGKHAFVAETTVRFRLRGPDRDNEWSTSLRTTFVQHKGRTYLANDREGMGSGQPLPLWLMDDVRTVRGENSMVIGAEGSEQLENYGDLADRAVPAVSEVWGEDWAEYLVLVVPRTQDQMERTIAAEGDSQTAVAAVTTSVGRSDPDTASHIVVNPSTFADIGALGRLVVLTHEVTHVATYATVSHMPMWLSEGFADYVGFRDAGLPTSRVARELLSTVREDGAPDRLPDTDDFDPRSGALDEAYEAAWSACNYVASRWDEKTLVRLYREVDEAGTEDALDQVFERVLGIGMAEFTADWREYVSSLAA